MDTPRPTIETEPGDGLAALALHRMREMKKRMPPLSPKQKRRMSYVVSKYRTKQMALLGDDYCNDPYPFLPTYVFYCFQGVVED
jgi:hypothetical protein